MLKFVVLAVALLFIAAWTHGDGVVLLTNASGDLLTDGSGALLRK